MSGPDVKFTCLIDGKNVVKKVVIDYVSLVYNTTTMWSAMLRCSTCLLIATLIKFEKSRTSNKRLECNSQFQVSLYCKAN